MKIVLIIFSLLIITTPVYSEFFSVDSETNQIIDSQGRQRIYHGGNYICKHYPYQPILTEFNPVNSYGQEDFDVLNNLGQNIMRYQVMWPGVFPQRDQVNTTYLNTLEQQINAAGENGIYTFIDMHQDYLGEKFCGDGMPDWLFTEEDQATFAEPINFVYDYDENGRPLNCSSVGDYFEYYFTYDISSNFQNLYKNGQGMRDEWVTFWTTVADYFKDNEYIIGYELINEPWAGDVFKNPLLLIPGNAEKWNFQKAYDVLNDEIRKIDENHLIFFEPVTWLNNFPSGFKTAPGGDQYADKSVFSYHYYVPPDITGVQGFMEARNKDIQKLGTAGFLSEFFFFDKSHREYSIFPEANVKLLDLADQYFQGWAGWDYKSCQGTYDPEENYLAGIFYGNGTVSPSIGSNISRTYAEAIAGKGVHMRFDIDTKDFVLEYQICIECGETIIFASDEYHYTNGVSINVQPTNEILVNKEINHRYTFKPLDDTTLKNGDTVIITIKNQANNEQYYFKQQ